MTRGKNPESDPRTCCAKEVIDVVPGVTFVIREVAARHPVEGFTFAQLRAMGIIRKRPGESLSAVALHLSLTVSSASRLIDGLVERGVVQRHLVPGNRRQVSLNLTKAGEAVLDGLHQHIEGWIGEQLADASEAEIETIRAALAILNQRMCPQVP